MLYFLGLRAHARKFIFIIAASMFIFLSQLFLYLKEKVTKRSKPTCRWIACSNFGAFSEDELLKIGTAGTLICFRSLKHLSEISRYFQKSILKILCSL